LPQSHADPAADSGDLEGDARGAVLHAPEVRALAAAADLHRAAAARGDSRDSRYHGESLLVQALLELTKPRITQLVLLTAAAGFYLGAKDRVDLLLLANTLIGTGLVAGGGWVSRARAAATAAAWRCCTPWRSCPSACSRRCSESRARGISSGRSRSALDTSLPAPGCWWRHLPRARGGSFSSQFCIYRRC